ncbi:hypothetical protein ACFLU9_00375 [Chloroflexota bacterium]
MTKVISATVASRRQRMSGFPVDLPQIIVPLIVRVTGMIAGNIVSGTGGL